MKKFFIIFSFLISIFSATLFAQGKNSSCSVKVKVEFLKTGKIGYVKLLETTCKNVDIEKKVIAKAKKIKFSPKKVNGNPITTTKTVGYSFSISDNSLVTESELKAHRIIQTAISKIGGNKYLQVKNSVGKGRFSTLKKGIIVLTQTFIDVIVNPDTERTDFSGKGEKLIQVNTGETGWVYQSDVETIRDQKERQIEGFKRSLRTHYNYLLRGKWKEEGATLEYVGRRSAGVGERNEVVKLVLKDGFEIEYEFSKKGLPVKILYTMKNSDDKKIVEENRYAQFLDVDGILTPFVVDHYTDKVHSFRVNYTSVKYNKSIPNSIFEKPKNIKKLRKKLKI